MRGEPAAVGPATLPRAPGGDRVEDLLRAAVRVLLDDLRGDGMI
jgi:hypothetical protein